MLKNMNPDIAHVQDIQIHEQEIQMQTRKFDEQIEIQTREQEIQKEIIVSNDNFEHEQEIQESNYLNKTFRPVTTFLLDKIQEIQNEIRMQIHELDKQNKIETEMREQEKQQCEQEKMQVSTFLLDKIQVSCPVFDIENHIVINGNIKYGYIKHQTTDKCSFYSAEILVPNICDRKSIENMLYNKFKSNPNFDIIGSNHFNDNMIIWSYGANKTTFNDVLADIILAQDMIKNSSNSQV
jgi:hypothetical protein